MTETHSDDSSGTVKAEREQLLIVYTSIIVLGTICVVCRSFSSFRMCLRISINLHDMIFRGITRAKMIFFHNNPSGRILNRFARDINNIDSLLPSIMIDVLHVIYPNSFYWFVKLIAIFLFFSLSEFVAIRCNHCDQCNCGSMAVSSSYCNDNYFLFDAFSLCKYRTQF